MKILLVIKDSDMLGLLAALLEKNGHDVTMASESVEAFRRLLKMENVGLLVASLNLWPDGAEPIVKAARLTNPTLPVLLIAGSQSNGYRERIMLMDAVFWQTGDGADSFMLAVEQALSH
ncbi:MAG: hypothetical protein UY03_C0010G0022 [Parcubacteria group bacterium GW2011_GWA2_47_64]|nr:MAG: hypothetical protein UY03_C0010G0022 [Parcubacteria group bacterium GW2011_GWA2_47_64]KKU97152.1 MAG: hypothetical protein UY29_C0002G0049 [Parcubacteria group bacterium GW2011_GWC2_48_17]